MRPDQELLLAPDLLLIEASVPAVADLRGKAVDGAPGSQGLSTTARLAAIPVSTASSSSTRAPSTIAIRSSIASGASVIRTVVMCVSRPS
jgi:hypothetical protein